MEITAFLEMPKYRPTVNGKWFTSATTKINEKLGEYNFMQNASLNLYQV